MRSFRPCCPRPAPLARLLVCAAVGVLVANCAGKPPQAARSGSDLDPRYGVRASPRVVAEGEPVPKGGGREMVGKPYTVGGRTYVPREDKDYARTGLASWYGAAFHGRLTANGEVFDQESLAAAHPTLPLPSYARVTNLQNGRSLIVRVNDRGPYHENRLIDVSQRAAEALDFRRVGTTRVRVEYVGRASIRGSDDAKLLASLRTDGRAAPHRGPTAPTLVAAAEPRPAGPRVSDSPAPEPRATEPRPVALAALAARPAEAPRPPRAAAEERAPLPLQAPLQLQPAAPPRAARADPDEAPSAPAAGDSRGNARPAAAPLPPARPVARPIARPLAVAASDRPAGSQRAASLALSYAAVGTGRPAAAR